MRNMIHNDEAVTETLGYIILFGIVLTAIALLLLFGNPIIETEKNSNNFKSIEQGFNIIQSDLMQVALDGTPNQSTLIHMESGKISANPDTDHLTVTGTGAGGPFNYDIHTGNIQFKSSTDLSSIALENGGVFERGAQDGSDFLVSKPRIYIATQGTSNTLVINVIKIKSAQQAATGKGNLNINLMYDNTVVKQYNSITTPVTLSIGSDYPNAWKRYLDDITTSSTVTVTSPSANTYTLSNVNNLIICEHDVDVSISGFTF